MVGQTISHYKVTEKLGEGGMGVVYKAEDTSLDHPVGLKFLAVHLVSDDARKRFEREAKAAVALNHPTIYHVYGIDEVEATGSPADEQFHIYLQLFAHHNHHLPIR